MKLFILQYLFYPYFSHFKELPSPIFNFLIFFGEDETPTHPPKILRNIPVAIAYNFQKQKYCKLRNLVHKWYLFTSCGKNNSLVNQLKTKVTLNRVIFITAKVLGKLFFCNFDK